MIVRRVWPIAAAAGPGYPDPARLRRDLDRLFDLFSEESPGEATTGVYPAMNVTQDGEKYYVRAELPGLNTEDLKISVERNKLSVSGERKIAPEAANVSYHRRERLGGVFSRSLTLPEDLNADAVEARYTDGVLTITLPKSEAVKPRQISVNAA